MVDLTKFSDEQLEKIAKSGAVEGSSQLQSLQNNFSSIPSSELRKIAAKDSDIGAMESIGRGALSTVTLGYAPEAIAAVKSAIGPEKFSEEVEKQKIAQEAAWEKHPYSYGAGFVGGMAPAFFTSRIAAPVATAGAGARLAYGALTSPNIASAAGKLLQNVPVIRGLGTTLEKPIVQGAIYGSSQGDTAEERLKEAGIGAVGAKIGEKIIPPVISAASAIPSAVMNTVSKYITGSPAKSKIAADLAAKHDIYLPAIVDAGPISSMVAKPDIGRNIANASAKTFGRCWRKIFCIGKHTYWRNSRKVLVSLSRILFLIGLETEAGRSFLQSISRSIQFWLIKAGIIQSICLSTELKSKTKLATSQMFLLCLQK